MKTTYLIFLILMAGLLFVSCGTSTDDGVVRVTAQDFEFMVADSIPSGWVNFKFTNTGHTEHFFLLNLLPDSITYEEYVTKVTEPFQTVFDSIRAGISQDDAVNLLVESIPSWYFTDVKQMGGSGIVSKDDSVGVTINLPPGTYAMECYIKEQGIFHTTLGMISKITVTNEISETLPPRSNFDITLSNLKIETQGALNRGKNICAIHFTEHPDVGLGNDIHIIKLTDDTDIDSVTHWLNWMNITGLQSPAPAQFCGGVQEMPIGSTAYFTVFLDSGDYAWISESSAARGMIKRFSIK